MPSGVYKKTPEHNKKVGDALRGKPKTAEHRMKVSIGRKGKGMGNTNGFKIGHKFWLGKKRDAETRKKISEAHKKRVIPENLPWWKGGISKSKDYILKHQKLRRIRVQQAGGFHSVGEWENLKAQYNWRCLMCSKSEPKIKLTKDHIIPIAKGGSSNIENIQPLCQRCNSKKGSKL